jgi:hypothetical protein
VAQELVVKVIGDTSSLERSFKSAPRTVEDGSKRISTAVEGVKEHAFSLARAFVPLAAGFEAGEFLKGGVEGAEHLAKAQESLQTAVERTGGSFDALKPRLTDLAKSSAEFGINQADATTALARATLITGDAEKGMIAYKEAQVIAAATGKDLSAVTVATSKAIDGHVGSLQRYGITVDKNASSQEQYNAVMARFEGQAQANTTATDKLSANFQNLQTNIGTLLLPVFNEAVDGLNRLITWLESPRVAAALGRMEDDFKHLWAVVKPSIDNIIDAAKLVTEFIEAHWATIERNMNALKTVVEDALKGVRDAIKLVDDLLHGDWSKAWNDAKHLVGDVIDGIETILTNSLDNIKGAALAIGKAVLNGIEDGITGIGAFILSTIHGIESAISNAAGDVLAAGEHFGASIVHGIESGITSAAKALAGAIDSGIIGPIDAVIGAWDSLHFHFDVPPVKVFGHEIWGGSSYDVGVIQIPQIPRLASGGIVPATPGGTLALLGEGGQDEAVMPLDRMPAMAPQVVPEINLTVELDGEQIEARVRTHANRRSFRLVPSTVTGSGAYLVNP